MPSAIASLLSGYPVIVEQDIAWGEMDAYQHVNNVVYFRYLENARVEYMRRAGWPEAEKATGVGPILQAIGARFRRPLFYPDKISIASKLGTMSEDRFTLEHIVVSHNLAEVATKGESTIVTYHYAEQRKVPIPEVMKQKILKLEESVSKS